MNEISGGVDEASEGGEEADEEGNVFHGGRGLARVAVDHLGHEGFRGRAAGPGADEGAERDGERGEVRGRRLAARYHLQCNARLLRHRLQHKRISIKVVQLFIFKSDLL